MKNFDELSKGELVNLNETQIDAYVDIELARQSITKPLNVVIDYPRYLAVQDALPERDMTVYEVDGYTFPDAETAQKLAAFIGSLPQVKTDYEWSVSSDAKYAEKTYFSTPSVSITSVYSEAKFLACKETIKRVTEKRKGEKKENENVVDSVIDYDAIDQVRYAMRDKVRSAMQFFAQAKTIAADFQKYLAITNSGATAYETLFTVYNIQNEDLKAQVKEYVNAEPTTE